MAEIFALHFLCRAFKHFKRSDFTSPNLAKKTVDSLSKVGINWMYISGEHQNIITHIFDFSYFQNSSPVEQRDLLQVRGFVFFIVLFTLNIIQFSVTHKRDVKIIYIIKKKERTKFVKLKSC